MFGTRTLHSCPACEMWQVDYDFDAVTPFVTYDMSLQGMKPNSLPFYKALDEIIREHLAECPAASVAFLLTQIAQPVL